MLPLSSSPEGWNFTYLTYPTILRSGFFPHYLRFCFCFYRLLLEHCEDLEYKNLSSCRGLPRGMKKEYHKNQMSALKKEVVNEMGDSD